MSVLGSHHKTLLLAVDFPELNVLDKSVLIKLKIPFDLITLITTVEKFKLAKNFNED